MIVLTSVITIINILIILEQNIAPTCRCHSIVKKYFSTLRNNIRVAYLSWEKKARKEDESLKTDENTQENKYLLDE